MFEESEENGACLTLGYSPADKRIVHVSEVARGKACACQCVGCGMALIARKGTLRAHHFAHESGFECSSAVETALHAYAKELFKRSLVLGLPEDRGPLEGKPRHPIVRFESVELEQSQGAFKPDAIGEVKGRKLFVEFGVTHFCYETKIGKIEETGISTLEVDLSATGVRLESKKDLDKFILFEAPRAWLFNALAAAAHRGSSPVDGVSPPPKRRPYISKFARAKIPLCRQAINKVAQNGFENTDISDFEERVEQAGFGEFLDSSLPGEWVFRVAPRV